jgi:hypothetical protein
VVYAFSGTVNAQGLAFKCMEGRRVVLFRVEPDGSHKRIAATETKFFGSFSGVLEKPLSAIPGNYYAKAMPKIAKSKRGRLRCLAARTPTFLVQVPAGLLTSPMQLSQ